jgi:hypothetical protein
VPSGGNERVVNVITAAENDRLRPPAGHQGRLPHGTV